MICMNSEIRRKLISEIKDGSSLNKVVSKFNLPKSTAYYYMKKIRGKKTKDVVLNEDKEKIGEFVGIFSGDGSFFFDKKRGNYNINIYTWDKEEKYANYIKKLISDIFVNSTVRNYEGNSVICTRIQRKFAYLLLKQYLNWIKGEKTYTVNLKEDINDFDKQFLRGFVRGLIDTDGSVDTYGRIEFSSCSKNLCANMKKSLEILGFNPVMWKRNRAPSRKDIFSVVIKRKELSKYIEDINFGSEYKFEKAVKMLS